MLPLLLLLLFLLLSLLLVILILFYFRFLLLATKKFSAKLWPATENIYTLCHVTMDFPNSHSALPIGLGNNLNKMFGNAVLWLSTENNWCKPVWKNQQKSQKKAKTPGYRRRIKGQATGIGATAERFWEVLGSLRGSPRGSLRESLRGSSERTSFPGALVTECTSQRSPGTVSELLSECNFPLRAVGLVAPIRVAPWTSHKPILPVPFFQTWDHMDTNERFPKPIRNQWCREWTTALSIDTFDKVQTWLKSPLRPLPIARNWGGHPTNH